MRKIAPGVFIENRFPGVVLGAIASGDGVLLVDSPLRNDDIREWMAEVSAHGRPRYLTLLDHHPDRVLGARSLDLTRVAHEMTGQVMSGWPDTFKGGGHPIGAEADGLKRITGVSQSVPVLTFSEAMWIHLGEREVHFWHRPGPMPGSIWVLEPEAKVAFIGDTVVVSEPPYLGEADVEAWLGLLDELRGAPFLSYRLVSAREGLVGREAITAMARFLRKVPHRLEKLAEKGAPPEAAAALAPKLMKGFRVSSNRVDLCLLRLEAGLSRLYSRVYSVDG